MAKVNGTARKPLPEQARWELTDKGWIELPVSAGEMYYAFRNKKYPKVLIEISATNMPGDTDHVFVAVRGGVSAVSVARMTDELLRQLLLHIDSAERGLNVRVER